jgi:tetratricopeptide (TPR) repeat protein
MQKTLTRIGLLTLGAVLLWGPAQAQEDLRAINRLLIQAGNAEEKNNPNGAIAAYSQILKLRPDDEPILVDRANAYSDKKDYAHAIADFAEALRLKPGDAMAHNNRGTVYLGRRDYAGALADFDAAVRLNPDYLEALGNRAMTYDARHDIANAIADYSAVLKRDPQNPDSLNARCWDRAFLNADLDAALADCNAALGLIKGRQALAAVRDSRGFVYFRKGDFVRAIADYDAALALAPKMAETLYKRGLAKNLLAKNRKGESGTADIAAALKLDPHAGDDMTEIGLRP